MGGPVRDNHVCVGDSREGIGGETGGGRERRGEGGNSRIILKKYYVSNNFICGGKRKGNWGEFLGAGKGEKEEKRRKERGRDKIFGGAEESFGRGGGFERRGDRTEQRRQKKGAPILGEGEMGKKERETQQG